MTVPQSDDSQSTTSTEGAPEGVERRKGSPDRRAGGEDRRNSDRIAQDMQPRRDPERKDRRKS